MIIQIDLMSIDGSPSIISKSVFIPTEVKLMEQRKDAQKKGAKAPAPAKEQKRK